MKELKRLCTGLLSASLVFGLIMAPIPMRDIAYAADTAEEDCKEDAAATDTGVYKAGCDLKEAHTKSTIDNPSLYHDSKIKQYIEQYVVGLFGLILINGLRFNYLYKYRPSVYGMDCPSNWGAKVSMPVAQLASLAYIIGDAQANVKFQMASKDAADAAFSAKEKNYIPDEDSEEVAAAREAGEEDPRIKAFEDNNKQMQAYDSLLKVLYAQEDAIKTKKNLTRAATVGFYLSEAAELANIISCTTKCTTSMTTAKTKYASQITSTLTTAITTATAEATALAICPGPCDEVGAGKCAALAGQLAPWVALYPKEEALIQANAATQEVDVVQKNVKSVNFFTKIFKAIKDWFRPTVNEEEFAANTSDVDKTMQDGEGVISEAADAGKMGKETAKVMEKASETSTQLAAIDNTECSGASEAAKNFTASLRMYLFDKVTCCGGPGITKTTQQSVDKLISNAASSNSYFKAQWEAAQAALEAEKAGAADTTASQTAGVGSYIIQGNPMKSVFHKTQDIKVFGLFEKKAMNIEPKHKRLLEDELNFTKVVMRSGIQHLLMSHYSNFDSSKPRVYLKSVAIQNEKLNQLMIYFDKELSGELKEMMHNDLIGYTPKMKKFVNKFFDLFGIPSAHAQGGMAMMAGSMLLSTLGNQIDDPWVKQIFNLGSRLLMLQGLLGKLAKDHALISPQNRAITWALMAVMGEVAISFLAETLEKVRKNIEVVEMERTRYFNSAATRTSIRNTERVGDATLKLKKYDYTASRTAGMKVKACAVPKGDGFAPAMCPAVIPKQAFSLPEISSGSRNHLNPDFLNGMSLLSDVSYGAATGSLDGANMSEGDLGKLETLQNALSQQNSKLRDKVDAHDSKIAAVKKFNSPSLQSVHASFKKEFGGGGKNSSGTSPIASTSSGGYFGGNKEEKKEESTGTSKTTAGTAGTAAIALPKSKGIDLDFGDDDAAAGGTVTDDALGAATSDKSEEKLDDFVLNHDDINKRADIPIWKILSNRYILSYPKILEEEEQKGSPPQSEPVQQ